MWDHKRMKAEMKRKGITARKMAEDLGVNEYTISRWIHGTHVPLPIFRKQIAKMLELHVETLEA